QEDGDRVQGGVGGGGQPPGGEPSGAGHRRGEEAVDGEILRGLAVQPESLEGVRPGGRRDREDEQPQTLWRAPLPRGGRVGGDGAHPPPPDRFAFRRSLLIWSTRASASSRLPTLMPSWIPTHEGSASTSAAGMSGKSSTTCESSKPKTSAGTPW